MNNKKMWKVLHVAASALCASVIILGQPIMALAATGTVTSANVKVRSEASTSSEQVSSLDSGDTVDIIDEATDSQGYVWYRIYVNGTEYGYVRSDLVKKSGSTTSSTASSTPKESLPQTQVTAVENQPATVTVASANVRAGAGTGYDTVGTVANGDTVTVTGEANGTDSKKWYQISFGSNGRTGFVRADLLQMGAAAPAETTETTETTETAEATDAQEGESVEGEVVEGEAVEGEVTEEAPVEETAEPQVDPSVVGNGEYSLAYKADETGTDTWYLYDNVNGTQVKLSDLLAYAAEGQKTSGLQDQIGKLKLALIIMAVIIAALVFAVLILIYKLRDYMYYEDEEEEEIPAKSKGYDDIPSQKSHTRNEQRVTPQKSQGRTVADSREISETVKPKRDRKAPMGTAESLMPERKATRSESSERRSSYSQRAEEPVRAQSSRKSRNFLLEDDDFEFEFLDLDDEDK
ncbi:SH3 domain-containing protein [Butyrivibrio sp. NC2002]|uniref:SH3 domain-containing protein n=1 Tax=Butyrivibrio sp. NC2002 TaxID=1410610 RepID=UPI00055B747B|nr:SH3 domain-containing protein [Butyrivibrio sp. NC2002]